MDRLETRRRNDGDHRAAQPDGGGVKKILIASGDISSLDRICSVLSAQSGYQLTCTSLVGYVKQADDFDAHDLLILDADDHLDLFASNGPLWNAKPAVIWVCQENNLSSLFQAVRGTTIHISSHHVIFKPVVPGELLDAAQQTMREIQQGSLRAEKYRKMRKLMRRVVRERRDINRRVELVCRDLVEAHRRLTYRFVQMHKSNA